VCALDEGAENVAPPSDEEVETVETCCQFEGVRLGCQLKVNGDITVRTFE
jgi:ferredoxin